VNDFERAVARLPERPGTVRLERLGAVAHIVLDAPRTRNALTPGMMVALARAAEACAGAGAIVLRGAGQSFCAGGDLVAVAEDLARPGMGRCVGLHMREVLARLEAWEVPIVGVLRGAAMGGGAELLAACDVVFAAPTARVGWVQARLGVSPGFGGGARLLRRVGVAHAGRLLVEAEVLEVDAACARGLVDIVAEDPDAAAEAWIAARLTLPDESRRAALRLARGPLAPGFLDRELEVFEALWGAPAHLEALARARARR
jgi:enoyl-CoA hydratase/carnithine racemase